MKQIEVALRRAPDDPPVNDPKFQEGLREFSKSLRTAGVTYSQRAMAFDSVDALGYPLPEFLVTLSQAIGPTLGVILVAWLQGRSGRKVRVKIGDVEAEARTVEEVEGLLQKIKQFQDDEPPHGGS
jgi:hypothetical protein